MYMLCRIKQLVESGSQFIVSTHSPIVMAYPGADIYEIADNGLQLTELEQTPHYLLMKRFCLDHEGMLRQLGFGIRNLEARVAPQAECPGDRHNRTGISHGCRTGFARTSRTDITLRIRRHGHHDRHIGA